MEPQLTHSGAQPAPAECPAGRRSSTEQSVHCSRRRLVKCDAESPAARVTRGSGRAGYVLGHLTPNHELTAVNWAAMGILCLAHAQQIPDDNWQVWGTHYPTGDPGQDKLLAEGRLRNAMMTADFETFVSVMSSSAAPNVNAPDEDGRTGLHYAVSTRPNACLPIASPVVQP
eukprot:1754909-Rhodomonas_salina.2